MSIRLLAVKPQSLNYGSHYQVEVARSFSEARDMIQAAELAENPYNTLDLPATDETEFWQFLQWMKSTDRQYSFSIFGVLSDKDFWEIVEKARNHGFHVNT